MLNNSSNMTSQSIFIDNFTQKQNFCYSLLYFKNIEGITNQGQILDYYFPEKNFLLLPRNIITKNTTNNDGETSTENYYTTLFLSWSEEKSLIKKLEEMLEKETNIDVYDGVINSKGKQIAVFRKNKFNSLNNWSDFDGRYSYIISHQYNNGVYAYRITSSDSMKQNLKLLEQKGLKENTVLDLIFTGRDSNKWHNTYNFGNFKVKDCIITNREQIILSNSRGLIDLKNYENISNGNGVLLLNFLPDYIFPAYMEYDYYSGMNIRCINFVPEDKTELQEDGKLIIQKYFKRVDPSSIVVLPKDEEVKKEIEMNLLTKSVGSLNEIFIASKTSIEDIIKKFDSRRTYTIRQEFLARKRDLIMSIAQCRREINDKKERIASIEYRIKEFIPFPMIDIKSVQDYNEPFYDVYSMLYKENGQYIVRRDVNLNELEQR